LQKARHDRDKQRPAPRRCFKSDPSIKSSLTFLRKTPWAREKVEGLYVKLMRTKRPLD